MRERLKWSARLLVGAVVLAALGLPVAARPADRAPSSAPLPVSSPPMALGQQPERRDGPGPLGVIEIQPGLGDETTLQDAHMNDIDTDSNFGLGGAIQVRTFSPGLRGLLRWSLDDLPPGSIIQSARLELYTFYRSSASPITIQAYEMLVPWDEATVTWNSASAGVPWKAPGAQEGTERSATAAASATIAADDPVQAWYNWDITGLVQGWWATPSSNNGLMLIGTGGAVRHDFTSSEGSATDQRPKLVIEYTQNGGTPTTTPTTQSSPTTGASATPTATRTRTPGPTVTPTITPDNWIDVSRAIGAFCLGEFEGDTTGKPNNASRYGTLDWNEIGPEDVYIVHKTVVSDLTVELVWWEGSIDLDVFLLYGPDPALLLDYSDRAFTRRDLGPGTYYVVVDGFEKSEGVGGYSGAYRLRISCQGEPTPTPTITPTPTQTSTPVVSFYPLLFKQPTPTPTPTYTPSPTPTFVPFGFAVNCGATEWYTYSDGFAYSPDKKYASSPAPAWGWEGGKNDFVTKTDKGIYATEDDPVFAAQRYGMTVYRFEVPVARYEVQLHFAEIFQYTPAGGRVFAVEMEGQRVLDQFDMVGLGLKYTAHTEVFQVNVVDGELTISFIPQSTSYGPAINGIRVRSIGAAQ